MEHMLNRLHIPHTRVPALDAKDPSAAERINLKPGQGSHCTDEHCVNEHRVIQFCTASHILALVEYLKTSDEPYALIVEDDVDMEAYSDYWEKPFKDYLAEVPKDWAIAQVSTIVIPAMHEGKLLWAEWLKGLLLKGWVRHRFGTYWLGAGAYVIKRETAEVMVQKYVRPDGVVDLDDGGYWTAVPDQLMFIGHVMYTLPLVSYTTEASTVHDEHMTWHINSKQKLRWLWAQSRWYRS
jgi:hypothetical protein